MHGFAHNISYNRRENLASVKKVINEWTLGGIPRVINFLNKPNIIIEKNSWVEKTKKLLEDKNHWISVGAEIYSLNEKFKTE